MAALTEPPIRNAGSGVRAAPPIMFTTCPRAVCSRGQNRRHRFTHPKNLSAKPSCQASGERSRNAPARVAPAELTRMSHRPWRSETRSNTSLQPSSRRRSAAQMSGRGEPLWTMASDAALRFASDDAARTVCAPSAANAAAMPRPMPRLPPVTTTTFPANSRVISLCSAYVYYSSMLKVKRRATLAEMFVEVGIRAC